jgi:nicotinate-nucleotide--dimethylbenzimidazole phosphoribosyltransferase
MTFDQDLLTTVRSRLASLTKPVGSLGKLEDIATQYCTIRGEAMPVLDRKAMYIFCGDHGITDEGVSLYPQAVTRQMVANFVAGGAAINVLCRVGQIEPLIVNIGVKGDPIPGVLNVNIAQGTKNMAVEQAMTRDEALRAIEVGRSLAMQAAESYHLVGLGEMGIGNTTVASAILSVLTGSDPSLTVGPGTGLAAPMVARKADVVRRSLELHKCDPHDGIDVLTKVGGFEVGAIAGFVLGAYEKRLPVVLDGFPCCAGVAIARVLEPASLKGVFFSHKSREPGHQLMLDCLNASPTLDLGMCLGEGTGAALMIGLIDSAVRIYREMATFEEAQVASAQDIHPKR